MGHPTATTMPHNVDLALRRVEQRVHRVARNRGVGLVAVAASAGLVFAMLGDLWIDCPSLVRCGLWAVWVVSIGFLAVQSLVRPRIRKRTRMELATIAERADVRLNGSLVGAVDLLEPGQGRSAHGSPGLIAALVDQAAGRAAGFDPRGAIEIRGANRWLAAGAGAVALVTAACLVWPNPVGILAWRFLAPWSAPDRVALRVEPGDRVVARGIGLKVEAKARARFGSTPDASAATLQWTDNQGRWQSARMVANEAEGPEGRAYTATLPGLAASTTYRVAVGSSRSQVFQVEVAQPPRVTTLEAQVEPPAYTRVAQTLATDPRRIEALAGSRVRLRVVADRPVGSIVILWPDAAVGPPRVARQDLASGGSEARFDFVAGTSGPFEVVLASGGPRGLAGEPDGGRVAVRRDQPPTLIVTGPPAPAESGPGDVLRVTVVARDDFGVTLAELHHEVRRDGATSASGQVKLANMTGRDARGSATLALTPLGLRPGDVVAWRVRALDGRPEALGGPNETWSDWSTVRIIGQAEPMQAKSDRLRKEAILARLDAIRGSSDGVQRIVESMRHIAEQARGDASVWDRGREAELGTYEADAVGVIDQLQALARDLENDPDFAPLARPARQVAEVEAEAARAVVASARQAPDAATRAEKLRPSQARFGATRDKVDELKRRLDALVQLADDRRKLGDLAAREEALANRANEPGANPSRLREDQEQVRRDLDALLTKAPTLRSGLLQAQAEEASKLAEQARALADRQRDEARRGVESDPADARFRNLAEAQRAIEDDARRLAIEVDEPLAENGRPRVDADPARRAVEPMTRGELDRGRQLAEESEAALRRLTRDLGEVPADPRALARRLARRQEAVANEVAAATAEARRLPADLPPDVRAGLVTRLAPLAERQEAISRMAAAIPQEGPRADAAREAREAVAKASANLRDPRPRDAEAIQATAKRTLQRLAEGLEDPNRRREESRRLIEEARRREEEIVREIDQKIAETAPRPDRPADRAARELADRLEPLARRQEEATKQLTALDVEPAARARRDLAAARARKLAEVIRQARDVAPAKPSAPEPRPPAAWHVVGPYPMMAVPPVPIGVNWPIGLDVPVPGPDGQTLPWKPVALGGDEGRVNLAQIFGPLADRSAFGLATLPSPARRKATLSIGSDDTLVVWLNGVRVFEQNGSRAYAPGQDKVEVDLVEGANRILVRCGNQNGEWQFSVNVTPPLPDGFDPARALAAREELTRAGVDAMAAADRMLQQARGQQPADDLARELAAEQEALATRPEGANADRARVLTALKNLPAPDAPAEKAEAVRRAEALARDPAPTSDAARAAAKATQDLAARLGGPNPSPTTPAALPKDPDLPINPDHLARAEDLARRQRHVREGLQALGAERAGPQDAIRQDTKALGQALKDLHDKTRESHAQSEWLARTAAEVASDQAPRAMTQAAEQMTQGRSDAAREARRQAADLVERAARHAEDLAAGLRTEAATNADPNNVASGQKPPSGLAEATASLREAAGQLAQSQAGAASSPAPAMQRAADAMRTAAQSPGTSPGQGPGQAPGPGMAGGPSDNATPQSGPAGVAAADLSALPDLVRRQSGRAWGELPARLRAEILQQAQGRPRAEYARLIELYFREIAAEPAPR